ncbi:unnamed protein product [Moneuplotes crassus]|uniref:Uncharacterized protein n=1 Tax=Euplotes crassus TaxID=5936 RepID=A0AAD1XYB5_EUPCR|nr:unnamed protein product [Moneuplotes crassus]
MVLCVVWTNVCKDGDQDVGAAVSGSFGVAGYTQVYLLDIFEDHQKSLLYFVGYQNPGSTPYETIIYKSDHNLSKLQVVTYNIYCVYFSMIINPNGDFLYILDMTTDSIIEIKTADLTIARELSVSTAQVNYDTNMQLSTYFYFSVRINMVFETCRWDMSTTNLNCLSFGADAHSNFVPISDDLLFFASIDTVADQYYLVNYNFSDSSNFVWKKSIPCPTSSCESKKSYSIKEFTNFIAVQIQTSGLPKGKRLILVDSDSTKIFKEFKCIDSSSYSTARLLYKGQELMYHSGRIYSNNTFFFARSSVNNIDQLREFEEDAPIFMPITSDYQVSDITTSSPNLTSSFKTLLISTSTSITENDITSTTDPTFTTYVALWNQDHIQSVQSNSSVQVDFTWACAQSGNYTDISFSLVPTSSNTIPEWVQMDAAKQELHLNTTPKLTEEKTFYFSLEISFNTEVHHKRFEITVEECNIMNCEVCQLSSPDLCETCTTDYEATDGQKSCSEITSMPGATEAAAAMVTSSVVLASASSMLSLTSINSIFSIMNSMQLGVLLPLVPDYISPKVLDFLSSMGFTMFSFDFIKFKDIPFVEAISNWVSYPQSDEYLNSLGLRSGSSIVNYLSLMAVIILVGAIHLCIFGCYLCTENSKHKKCNKFLGALLKFLTFNIYIRIFIQAFSFTTLSIFSELYMFNLSTTVTKVSLGLCIVFGICTSVLFILSFIMYAKSFPEFDKKKYWPCVEYFNGIKPTKFSKLYSSLFMLLRLLLSSLLIFGATVSGSTKGTYFYLLNIVYGLYLIGVRPFENPQDSVIEIINQTMFCCLSVPLSWLNTKESWTPFYESYYTTIFMVSPAICSLVCMIFLVKSIVISIIKWKRNKAKNNVVPKKPSPECITHQRRAEHAQDRAPPVSGHSSSISKSNLKMIHAPATKNYRKRKLDRARKVKIGPRI